MAKYIRRRFGYSQATGRKIPYDDLVQDGYYRGLTVAKDEADQPHPQDNPIDATDNINSLKRFPPIDANLEEVRIGDLYDVDTDTFLEVRGSNSTLGDYEVEIT